MGCSAHSKRIVSHAVVRAAGVVTLLAASVFLAACTGDRLQHGHYLTATDLQQVQPGMSQDQVKLSLGTPTTQSTIDGNSAYYYVSTVKTQTAFFKPKTVDRKVVAVYFDPFGTVDRVAQYGLQDGKVVDFVTRKTPSQKGDGSFISQFFRGIGRQQIGSDQK